MKKKLAVLLAAALTLGMTACGASKGAGDTGKSEKGMVYAVEAGSAGEKAAKEKGFQYNSVSSQADALMEVASGTSDAAIIDLLMAGAMIGEGTSYPNLKHTDELTTEEYGVGCRKGSDLASYINQVFADAYIKRTHNHRLLLHHFIKILPGFLLFQPGLHHISHINHRCIGHTVSIDKLIGKHRLQPDPESPSIRIYHGKI